MSSKQTPTGITSCLIKNNSDAEVNVQVEFAGIEDHHAEIGDIEIAHGEEQRISEKEFEHGETKAKQHKTVEAVRVRRYDGSTLELKKPFDGATAVTKFWIFDVRNDSIQSVNPDKK